ncbi:unnamed protein product [Blepharisma stoltei]|uniref:Uncharacterized protein n=1 Tax=Blepharisma stoltei TaxID=1481888 RepID=A0AAU9IYD4_9CILI|nr:unnamed protein product [Blepharisma stoltei]
MKWPSHLLKNYHDPFTQTLDFPFRFGTFGTPSNDYWFYHKCIEHFGLTSADKADFVQKFIDMMFAFDKNDKETLKKIMKEEIYEKSIKAWMKLRNDGYRAKLLNRWEKVIEYRLFGYITYTGISPIINQNFSPSEYDVLQINALGYPVRLEFSLRNKTLLNEISDKNAVIEKSANPYYIRNFPRDSKHLHELFEKYPIMICQVDFGLLSKMRFQIYDKYSQNSLADGEADPEEYEFHIIRFEKLFPRDKKQYDKEYGFRRFIDANFEKEFYNWQIVDIDQYINSFPFPKE